MSFILPLFFQPRVMRRASKLELRPSLPPEPPKPLTKRQRRRLRGKGRA